MEGTRGRPEEAVECFLRTRMDALAIGPDWSTPPDLEEFWRDLCVLGGKKGLIYAVHNDYVSTRSHHF